MLYMRSLVAAAVATTLFLASTAEASPIPIFSMSDGESQSGQNATYSFDFMPVQNITVDSLGFFDFGEDGLAAAHRVGIWTTTGTLLTSATLTTADSVLSGPVIFNTFGEGGQFRYTSITPLNLLLGVTYRLGAAIEGAPDVWFAAGTNLSAAPSLATVSSTGFYELSNFVFPDLTIGNTYLAGNLTASPTGSAVPEPASLLLLSTGLAAAGLRKRLIKTRRYRLSI